MDHKSMEHRLRVKEQKFWIKKIKRKRQQRRIIYWPISGPNKSNCIRISYFRSRKFYFASFYFRFGTWNLKHWWEEIEIICSNPHFTLNKFSVFNARLLFRWITLEITFYCIMHTHTHTHWILTTGPLVSDISTNKSLRRIKQIKRMKVHFIFSSCNKNHRRRKRSVSWSSQFPELNTQSQKIICNLKVNSKWLIDRKWSKFITSKFQVRGSIYL